MKNVKIFVDMDGTLVKWNSNASIEEVATKGYFRNLLPLPNMVEAVERLSKVYDVTILSSVFVDDHSVEDKNYWIDTHFRNMKQRIFVPYGENKYEYLMKTLGKEKDSDGSRFVLIDDFTKNLLEWKGVGIKCLNGINHTKGTWQGYMVNGYAGVSTIYNTISGILMSLFGTPATKNHRDIVSAMTPRQKDDIYRMLWSDHVKSDVMQYLEENDCPMENMEEIADNVVYLYVYEGTYDCNLGYWDNIMNLISIVTK